MLAERPLRALLRLAAPTTGVMSIAALSNVLNTYFVSRLGSEAIAAVSLVFPVALILTTLIGGGIGAGVSSAVARALGAGKSEDANAVAEHAFALTVFLGVVLSIALAVGAAGIFRLMGAKGEVLDDASAFSHVLFGGLLITFFVGTCDSVLRGEGNVRVPAMWSTLSLVSQIVLTPLFMFTFGLGIRGAPAATLTGQLIGLGPRLRHIFSGKAVLRPRLLPRALRVAPLAGILRVGIPATLGTLVNYLGMMVLTTVMARFGTAELAAFGLCSRLDFLLLTVCYGTGVAVLTLVGFAAGAGRSDLVAGYTRRAVLLMAGTISVPAVVLWLEPQVWFGLFTQDGAIAAVGSAYFRIIAPTYPFLAMSMMLAFAFQGIGRATLPLATMSLRVTLVVVGALVLPWWLGLGVNAVFALMAAVQCLSAGLLSLVFRASMRSKEPVLAPI
jgi:MATE family, multidrug efflux pump